MMCFCHDHPEAECIKVSYRAQRQRRVASVPRAPVASARRWRNAGDRVKAAALNWHYFLTSTHSERKEPVVNGGGGSLAVHKVRAFAFLRPSPRLSRGSLCGAVGVLIWPPIKSSLACAQNTPYNQLYSLTHSSRFWNVLNAVTKSFRRCYK